MGTAVSSCSVMWEISHESAFYRVHLHMILHTCWVICISRFLDWLKVTHRCILLQSYVLEYGAICSVRRK